MVGESAARQGLGGTDAERRIPILVKFNKFQRQYTVY